MPANPLYSLPNYGLQAGLATPYGITLPPSQQVIYVRSTGVQNGDNRDIAERLVPTLSAALAQCRSGYADTVVCLPGHSESVADATMLTNLVAGTKIIGVGHGSNRPVFRFTATASQWAISVNDVIFANLYLRLEGANGVVKAIAVTGNDVVFYGNEIQVSSGASNKATIAIEVGTGAAGGDRFVFDSNIMRGVVAGTVTNGLLVSNAADGIRIVDNEFMFGATTTNGNVNVAAAATNLRILRNYMFNQVAASTTCIRFADVAAEGIVANNLMNTLNNGTASAQGITFAGTTNPLVKMNQNFCCDEPQKSGILAPGPAT